MVEEVAVVEENEEYGVGRCVPGAIPLLPYKSPNDSRGIDVTTDLDDERRVDEWRYEGMLCDELHGHAHLLTRITN